VAHLLRGRDALNVGGEILPVVLGIQGGTLREDESVRDRIVARRQCMHIDVRGFLTPRERCLYPSLLVKVVCAQIKRDNCRPVFHRRAHKGVLGHLGDSRRKLHLHGHCPLPSFATTDSPWNTWRRG